MNEFNSAIERERAWDKHLNTMDRGSYCEDPANDYAAARKIYQTYKLLSDLLLDYERKGYKFPKGV